MTGSLKHHLPSQHHTHQTTHTYTHQNTTHIKANLARQLVSRVAMEHKTAENVMFDEHMKNAERLESSVSYRLQNIINLVNK